MAKGVALYKNSIYNVLYKMLNVIFPLISSIYLAHIIFAEGTGKVASAQNITQYFVLVASLGIPNYGTREISKNRDSIGERNKVFSELFTINMLSTLVCIIAYYSMVNMFSFFEQERVLYYVTGLNVVLNLINVDWFYQGCEEYKYIAFRSLFIKMISLICLILFVRKKEDYVVYALIYSFAIAGNNIFNIINLKQHNVKISFHDVDYKKHLKPVFILLCTTVAIELYTLLDTTMITFFCNPENVAYYTNSVKIVRILITLISAIGGVLLPRLSYYREQGITMECNRIVHRVFHIMLFFFLPCCVGLFLCSDYVMPLFYGDSFIPGVKTLKIASILILTLGFSNLFGTQVLLTFDNEKGLLFCTILGAVSNVSMNAFLIPRFQQEGAITASVISEAIVTVACVCLAKRYISIAFDYKSIGISLISTVAMGGIVIIVKSVSSNLIFGLIVSVLGGSFVYFFLNVLLRNPMVLTVKQIMLQKSNSLNDHRS